MVTSKTSSRGSE